jgi:hypothetical protein
MEPADTKGLLWANALLLMEEHYGGEALGRFATDVGIGAASMTRLKKQDTAVGVDILEKIANRFELQPWQLLAPNLGGGLYRVEDKQLVAVIDFPQAKRTKTAQTVAPLQPQESQWRRRQSGRDSEAKQKRPPSKRRRSEP